MNTKLFYSLSIVAVAFTLVLGFGTLNVAKAIQVENGDGYTLPLGVSNLFGADPADNSALVIDRDRDAQLRAHEFDTYGMLGVSQG